MSLYISYHSHTNPEYIQDSDLPISPAGRERADTLRARATVPRSTTLEKWMQSHYHVSPDVARAIAKEAMQAVQPDPGVLFDKNLSIKCVEIAREREIPEIGTPLETKRAPIEWIPIPRLD